MLLIIEQRKYKPIIMAVVKEVNDKFSNAFDGENPNFVCRLCIEPSLQLWVVLAKSSSTTVMQILKVGPLRSWCLSARTLNSSN